MCKVSFVQIGHVIQSNVNVKKGKPLQTRDLKCHSAVLPMLGTLLAAVLPLLGPLCGECATLLAGQVTLTILSIISCIYNI